MNRRYACVVAVFLFGASVASAAQALDLNQTASQAIDGSNQGQNSEAGITEEEGSISTEDAIEGRSTAQGSRGARLGAWDYITGTGTMLASLIGLAAALVAFKTLRWMRLQHEEERQPVLAAPRSILHGILWSNGSTGFGNSPEEAESRKDMGPPSCCMTLHNVATSAAVNVSLSWEFDLEGVTELLLKTQSLSEQDPWLLEKPVDIGDNNYQLTFRENRTIFASIDGPTQEIQFVLPAAADPSGVCLPLPPWIAELAAAMLAAAFPSPSEGALYDVQRPLKASFLVTYESVNGAEYKQKFDICFEVNSFSMLSEDDVRLRFVLALIPRISS